MKYKVFLAVILLVLPFVVLAANFERDLYFGLKNDPDVKGLQEFLRDQSLYSGPVNGNFFSLTREAVKKFQAQEKITPVLGYFGAKTRARADSILPQKPAVVSREFLIAQIQALQAQLQALQEKFEQEIAAAATSTPVASPPAVTPPVLTISPVVSVSGQATSTFPEVEAAFFKLGEFTVYNGSSSDVLFANFETEVVDEMDSLFNRNRKVNFMLRDGVNSSDALISSTEFTFIQTPPEIGKPHISPLNLAFGVKLKPGEQKTVSFWIEQMRYVRSGTLQIRSTKTVVVTETTSATGKWSFALTREPPL